MAINYPNFLNAPIQESPLNNIFENAFKGYSLSQAPQQLADEKKQRQLANAIKEKALAHKDTEYSLSDQLKRAKIGQANRPEAIKGALANAFNLRKSLDPNSTTYEKDLGAVNNYINKLGASSNGVQISTSPDGGVEVSVGGKGETANVLGLPRLPKGQTYLFDDNQKPIGVGKPLSETEKKEAGGREYFNTLQPFLNKAQAPYSGKGSTKQFESDVINYSTDVEAKNRIDNLLAADKLLFSGVVKENATLGGANTNKVYDRLTKSLKNSEVYPLLKEIAKYQLPQGYTEASGNIFNKILNEATEKSQNLPAYKASYFNKKNNIENSSAALSKSLNENKKSSTKVIKVGNDTYDIPAHLVQRFLKEHPGAKANG